MRDPRRPGSVRHSVTVVIFYGLLLFLFQYVSRRKANRHATSPTLLATLQQVFPNVTSVPHYDTVERLLRTMDEPVLENALEQQIQRLLRQRSVQQYLVVQHWVVAIDGSQKFARRQSFTPEALQQKVSETDTRYRVYVVEAVLVTESGLSLPLMSTFAENDPETPPESKQDCEPKAFRRLAARLKQWFPRRRLLVVLDGLYPNGPIMVLCQRYHWDFIVFPQQCLPSVWAEVHGLRRLDTAGEYRWGDRQQVFTWVNAIEYEWFADGKRHTRLVHVACCDETWVDAEGEHTSHWAWISGQPSSLDD